MTSRTTNHVSSPWWGAPWSRLRKHRERVMSTWIWTRTRAEAPASRGPPFALANRVSSWIEEIRGRRSEARVERASRSWRLRDDDTLLLRPGRHGLALQCHSGTLLVTQEGDRLDHVLGPRDLFQTTSRGSVAVWALSGGELGEEPVSASPP